MDSDVTQHTIFVTYRQISVVTERVVACTAEEAIRRVRDGFGEEVSHESQPSRFVASDCPPAPAGRWHLHVSGATQ